VKEGMTLEQIEATVGGPPGVYTSRPDVAIWINGDPFRIAHKKWVASDGTLYVAYDMVRHKALQVQVYDPQPDNRSLFQRLRDRLGF
jgi:hypothetical protein